MDVSLIDDAAKRQKVEQGIKAAKNVVRDWREKANDGSYFDEYYNRDPRNKFLLLLNRGQISPQNLREKQKYFEEQMEQLHLAHQNKAARVLKTVDGHSFLEHQVLGDGNCGFTALGLDRTRAVLLVTQILRNADNPLFDNIRVAMIGEMRENLAMEYPADMEFINTYEPSPDEIIRYVTKTYGTRAQGGREEYLGYGLNNAGMMAAIAHAYNMQIQVFIQHGGYLQNVFTHHAVPIPGGGAPHAYYLLHTGEGQLNHFNLLQMLAAPAHLSPALSKPMAATFQ